MASHINVSHIDVVDMNWIRVAQDWARQRGAAKAEMRYDELKKCLGRIRAAKGLPPAERSIAVMALDWDNPRQQALAFAMEKAGFFVKKVDFRHAYVSTAVEEGKQTERAPQSLSHWLTYYMGLVAGSSSRSVVVVSAAYEVAGPMEDFATREGTGHAVIVFFRRLLNKRWIDNGLFNEESSIEWADLEKDSKELLGVNLQELVRKSEAARQDQRPL